MPILFRCTNCDQPLSIARRKAGLVVRCPKCSGAVVVPAAESAGPAAKPLVESQPSDGAAPESDEVRKFQEPSAGEGRSLPPEAPAIPLGAPARSSFGPTPANPAAGLLPHHEARPPAYELLFALVAMLAITLGYLLLAPRGISGPGSPLGHTLGIAGFLLMLSTETLYSLRKHVRGFTFGRMSTWLHVHIFTGIVGPYLVLLHAAWKFHGLAGVLLLLTGAMVVSGFIGRYIYTAAPRSLDGAELAVRDLANRIADADRRLQALGVDLSGPALALATQAPRGGWTSVLGRTWLSWRQRWRVRRALRQGAGAGAFEARLLKRLLAERFQLQLQIESLAAARRLLALWHVFHVPLGVAVFTLAFIHIGATLYFATFMK